MQGSLAAVVRQRRVGTPFEQQGGHVAVSLPAGVVQGRVALGIAPVEGDASPVGKDLHDVLLAVAAGVQKGLVVVHDYAYFNRNLSSVSLLRSAATSSGVRPRLSAADTSGRPKSKSIAAASRACCGE